MFPSTALKIKETFYKVKVKQNKDSNKLKLNFRKRKYDHGLFLLGKAHRFCQKYLFLALHTGKIIAKEVYLRCNYC